MNERPPNAEPPASDSPGGTDQGPKTGPETRTPPSNAVAGLTSLVGELVEYLTHYLTATLDSLRLKGRQNLRDVELAIIAVLAVAGLLVVGATLLFQGIAGGLAQLFDNRPWLGNVGAGLLLLGCTVLAMIGWNKARDKIARERTMQKYEQRKLRQREKFGRDVTGRNE